MMMCIVFTFIVSFMSQGISARGINTSDLCPGDVVQCVNLRAQKRFTCLNAIVSAMNNSFCKVLYPVMDENGTKVQLEWLGAPNGSVKAAIKAKYLRIASRFLIHFESEPASALHLAQSLASDPTQHVLFGQASLWHPWIINSNQTNLNWILKSDILSFRVRHFPWTVENSSELLGYLYEVFAYIVDPRLMELTLQGLAIRNLSVYSDSWSIIHVRSVIRASYAAYRACCLEGDGNALVDIIQCMLSELRLPCRAAMIFWENFMNELRRTAGTMITNTRPIDFEYMYWVDLQQEDPAPSLHVVTQFYRERVIRNTLTGAMREMSSKIIRKVNHNPNARVLSAISAAPWIKSELMRMQARSGGTAPVRRCARVSGPDLSIHVLPQDYDTATLEGLLGDHPYELLFPGSQCFVTRLLNVGGNCISLENSQSKNCRVDRMSQLFRDPRAVQKATTVAHALNDVFRLTDAENMADIFRLVEQSSGYKVHFKKKRMPLMRRACHAIKNLTQKTRTNEEFQTARATAAKLIARELKLHDNAKPVDQSANRNFWSCFGRKCKEVVNRGYRQWSVFQDFASSQGQDSFSCFAMEIVMLWKAIDLYLDPSFSLHVFVIQGDTMSDRRALEFVAQWFQCSEIQDFARWYVY